MLSKNMIVVAVVAVLVIASVGVILLVETEDKDPQINILAQVNSEGSAIFVSGEINSLEDFGGKIFATPGPDSIQHMMLMNYITEETDYDFRAAPGEGVEKSDDVVYWTQVGPVQMKDFLEDGTIQGGIAWEPYNSQIVAEVDGAWIYKWSDELIEAHPCCVLAVNSEFEQNNPETVERFVAAHVVATAWIMETVQDNTSANYSYMVDIGSKFAFGDNSTEDKEVTKDSLSHVAFDYAITDAWKSSLEDVVDTYATLGLFEKDPESLGYDTNEEFVDTIVNTTYLENAANVSEADEADELLDVRVGWLAGDIHQLARLVAMDENIGAGLGYGDRSIFEAFGLNIIGGDGNPYANGGVVMDAFFSDDIDIGYLGAPPAILRTVNAMA